MDRRIAAALLLTLFSATARGGVNSWSGIGPPGGNATRVVYGISPGTAFALVGQGVYRSGDGGASWQVVKSDFAFGTPRGLAVDPSDPSRVYVAVPEWPSLLVSTDGGATFAPLASLPTAAAMARQVIVSEDGRTLYLGSGNRVFRSVDRGGTWAEVTPPFLSAVGALDALRMEPGDPRTVYADGTVDGGQSALLRTRDGGQSWTVLYSAPGTITYDLAMSAADPALIWAARSNGLFRSNDHGATWTAVRTGQAISAVVADPANASVVIAASADGLLLRSADSGSSWQDITHGERAGQSLSLAMDRADSARMLVGGLTGIWGTTDSGVTWSARNAGLLASNVDEISADEATGRIYFNAQADGLYHATGAAAPVAVDNVELGSLQPGPQYVTSMLSQPGRLFAALTAGLARSTDGGNSWAIQRVAPDGVSQQLFDLQSSPLTPQTILAAGRRGLYRSTDGGVLWSVAGSGLPPGAEFSRMRVAPSDGRRAYATLYDVSSPGPFTLLGIHRSGDGGLTWERAGSGVGVDALELLAVDPSNANTIYGGNSGSLRKSTDAGTTWTDLTWSTTPGTGQPFVLAVDPGNPAILYAANVVHIARSVDGGVSWETLHATTDLPHYQPQQLFVDPFRPATLLLSTYAHGVQELTIAPDLLLSGTSPSPAGVGMPLVHTFTVRNLGPYDATRVAVRLRWPASATGVSVVASIGSCTQGTNTATCTLPILRNGSTATVLLTATAAAIGDLALEASVEADEPDPVIANNAVLLFSTIGPRADLSVVATGTATVASGGNLSYTLTVRNAGPGTAATPSLAFQLSPGVAPGTVTTSTGSCSSTGAGALVSCTFGDLAPDGAITVTVAATANSPGTLTSTARLTSVTADGSTADNSVSLVTTVTAPSTGPTPPAAAADNGGGGGAISLMELLGLWLLAALALRRRVSSASPTS